MHTLAWRDHKDGEIIAYGRSPESIKDVLRFKGLDLPVTLWPMKRWTYGHRLAPSMDIYPINMVMPAHPLEVDGKRCEGSSLFLTGPCDLGRTGHPSFTNVTVFHIENFFGIQQVNLMELLLALPDLIVRNKERMMKTHGAEG